MPSRPIWLAVGVVAAAGTGQLGGVAAAAGTAASLIVATPIAGALRRRPESAGLAAAAVGAALVVARLTLTLIAAGASGAGGPGSAPLPVEPGTWRAVVAAARTVGGQQLTTLRLDRSPVVCSAQLAPYPRLTAGDTVEWTGRLRALGDSDYERWLAAQGVDARCEATSFSIAAHDGSLAGQLEGLRQGSGDALQRVLPEPEGGLAAAILIGLRDRVDRGTAADFTTAGVSHIVAISGWNIAIVAATINALLGGLPRRRRAAATIAAIVGYTLFAGASPSVVRAAAMAGVALAAVESGRGSRAATGLAWAAALMILAEPAVVGDAGFQLSAAATAGLVAWATPLTALLGRRAPWLPAPIRDSLGISLSAQAATLPIVLLVFGRLALIAPAANLVAVPLVPPAMAAGVLAFLAGWLAALGAPGWLTGLLALPEWALLAALVGVVHAAASIPGANATLAFPANVVAAALACLPLWLLHRRLAGPAPGSRGPRPQPAAAVPIGRAQRPGRRGGGRTERPNRRPGLRATVAAAFVVALAGGVVAARPDGSVHVIVLDVGQGDAILVEGDRGSRLLVDGGPDGAVLLAALDRRIPPWDRRLDAIVLTHPHDDHVGGLATILDRYHVGRAFESGWPASGPAFLAWRAALSAHRLAPERLRTGDTIALDRATLRVLWPDDGTTRPPGLDPGASDNRRTNDSSIVLLGEFENRRFLLTGDAEDDVDPVLLARGLGAVDLLKVPHHGSATASSEALLEVLRPRVAVVSVGANNDYGHPAPSTLARLRANARAVVRTDQAGSVDVALSSASVTVQTERGSISMVPAGPGFELALGLPAAVLLYDSIDVRPEPSRKRGTAALARSARLAPAPLVRRRRNGGLAGVARRRGRAPARSRAGGGRGASARRGQAAGAEGLDRRAGPCRGLRSLAGAARAPGAGPGDRGPPGHAPGRRRLVRGVAPFRVARGAGAGLRRQAGRPAAGEHGRALRLVGAALPAAATGRQGPRQLVP